MTPEQLVAALAAVLAPVGGGGPHYRATPSTPSTPYYTGPRGVFGVLGLSRDVISSRIQPMGLADRLPVLGTNEISPYFPYFTGFLDSTGTEPVGVCDDPPTVGSGKSCIQTAQFGRYSRQTRTLEINHLGQQINRGEFQDLRFLNDPILGGMGGITLPNGVGGQSTNLGREVLMRMIELGADFQTFLSRTIYEGNPANNTGGGGYKEFPGLDILVGTNKVDAFTGTPCPSLASDIKNFNYGNISNANATTNAALINALSYMLRYIRFNASQMQFGETQWAFVMRPALFWEITAMWPCLYTTYRCQTTAGNEAIVDAESMIRLRDDMRNGNYILLDGIKYPVILDSNIREDTNTTNGNVPNPCFASDIYVLPLTVKGGTPVLYWEFFDYRTSMGIAADGQMATNFFWTDEGRYMWHMKPPTNFCLQWLAKIESRIILKTPQLAGRLTNVVYCPLQHERDSQIDDPYHVNGGVQGGRSAQPLYSDWNPTTPA